MNRNKKSGFTLIELLVVVAIISLLAAMAIPLYAQYKQQAVDADMQSALNKSRQAMEAYYERDQTYVGATVAELEALGYRGQPTVTLSIPTATAVTYFLRACALGGTSASWEFDPAVGSMVSSSTACS